MDFKDKNIIVTGGAAGIGKELVKQLLNKGANVSAIDINLDNLNLLKNELSNDKLKIYQLDVSNREAIRNFKELYLKENNHLDILINNAGIIQPFVNLEDLDPSIIEKVMNVNFYGPLNLIKEFLEELKTRPVSHILNVSSMGGFFPFPSQSAYGASKAALNLLTEGLYAELLYTNVRVSLVLPGAMATDIAKNSNVEFKESSTSKMKMLSADKAASQIISVIEKNKFKVYIGNDSKFMNILYKIKPKSAIKYINNLMSKM